MTPTAILKATYRNALINASGAASVLSLFDGTTKVIDIPLANPIGVADSAGVALTVTDFAQVAIAGSPTSATLYNSSGGALASFTAGVDLGDGHPPELVLPQASFYAGAFVRLNNSRIDL